MQMMHFVIWYHYLRWCFVYTMSWWLFELTCSNQIRFVGVYGLDWNALFRVDKIVEKNQINECIMQVPGHTNRYVSTQVFIYDEQYLKWVSFLE